MRERYPMGKGSTSGKFHKVTLYQLAILLANVWKASKEKKIGFEDANQTIDELTRKLDKEVWVAAEDLESALWSCNLLNEEQKFWHPKDDVFGLFTKLLLNGKTFNKDYNFIERDFKK